MLLVTEKYEIVAQDDLFLKGRCKRCGECCLRLKCKYLEFETLDGNRRAVCTIYMKRPVGCALWPMKDDKLPPSCGFYWEKI